MYRKYFKPTLDIVLALFLIVTLSPILFFGLIAASYDSRGKPFFVHTRPGYLEKPIGLLKFRTMRDEYDRNGRQLGNIERITKIGRLLRTTSIDELPQLFNVALGQLSLVGPRPLQTWYLPHYTPRQRLRHSARPGITGLAQVSGRNSLSWEEKFELDVEYVESQSFWLDLKILVKTCVKVFNPKEVNSGAGDTMEAFVKKTKNNNSD